jgi:hypothetical protein
MEFIYYVNLLYNNNNNIQVSSDINFLNWVVCKKKHVFMQKEKLLKVCGILGWEADGGETIFFLLITRKTSVLINCTINDLLAIFCEKIYTS